MYILYYTVMGEIPGCVMLSGTVVDENLDHVCWVYSIPSDPQTIINEPPYNS